MTNDWPMYPENWYAAGGMYSTVPDLQKFASALFADKLLKPDSLTLMLKPGLDDYGYGVWISGRKVGGKPDKVVERFGSILGANCVLSHIMGEDITIIILSNTNATDLGDFSAQLGNAAAVPPED
jgi:D-alanyl-D-alanine carboxypeptidase